MESKHDNEESNLANNGVSAKTEQPVTKIINNKQTISASRENVKLLAEIDILPFVGKAEPPEPHPQTGSLSREQVLVENFVPEVGNEIIVKTENEYLVPTEEGKRQSVSSAVVEPGDNFKGDNLPAEEVAVEKSAFHLATLDTHCSSEAVIDHPPSRNKYTRKLSPANSTISNPARSKCHNLSVSELRRRLSVCPVCQFQYTSYKLATVCLTKHGKRQCWLCLDVLSTRKDDYYRHCIEFHSISRTGDNVGCPFCPKFFDFRQGLNQHIVKIHFAENISDLYAVASLSPKTLVDIFTGQPRETSPNSSKATPSLSRESSCGCELDTIPEELPLMVKTIFDNAFKNLDTSSPIEISSAVIPPPATPLNDGVVCNRQAFPNLSKTSSLSSNSPGSSVIRLLPSRGCAQKMAVPPEQTMKSLAEQIAIGESGSILPLTSPPFPHHNPQQLLPAQNRYSGENPEEHDIEVVDNASLKFHRSESDPCSYNYDFGRNQPSLAPSAIPSTAQMSTVTSDPEKYEMSFYPGFPPKGRFQEGTSSVIAASFGGDDDLRSAYEKDIIRMDTSGNSARINSYEAPATNIIATVTSPAASRPNEAGENRFACLTEAEKNYLDSITKLLESSEMEFNSGIVEGKSNGNDTQSVSTIGNPSMEITSSITECSSSKEGHILDLDIKPSQPNHPSDPPKQPPLNCGVKRRILMKAMWDEQNHHQVKKPTVPGTHALVHDLHAATSFLTQPVTSSPKLTSPAQFILTSAVDSCAPANVAITSSVHRSYNEVCFGVKAEQKLQPPQSVYVSQGEVIKHAGPFFEQYVRQEGKKPENPYKLLNITGSSRPPEMSHLGNRKNLSCIGGRSWSHTSGGGCMDPGPNMHCGNESRSPNQRQALTISSPTYTRPQFPTPYQFPIRKGSNPTFWDNLRARLMTQSSHKLSESGTFSRSNDLTRGPYCGIPKLESVIVKNPFEEEVNFHRKSRRISSIPSLLELKLENDMNQLPHHGGISSQNMSRCFQPPPLLPSHFWRDPTRQLQQFHHPFSGINIPSPGMIRRSNCGSLGMGQREFPSSSLFQPPLAPPPTPAPRYQLHQQHQQMMDQCRRISHGSIREFNPQSYNSRYH